MSFKYVEEEIKMNHKRILVTGEAGFIGSHLCEKLLLQGNDVVCMDNLFTGQKDNIRHLMDNPYFEFIRQDILENIYVECDQIYNLACPASPIHYQYDPIKTGKTSVVGALHTLGLAKRCHARILQASTSKVYGDPEIRPQPESYRGCVNPNGVRSCYDEGKRMAETLFFDYHRQHGVDIKVIQMTGSKSKIVYLPLPQDDPTQRKPVIELTKEELDWEPTISLEEGLVKTI